MIAGEKYGTPDPDGWGGAPVNPEARKTFVIALCCVIALLPAIAAYLLPYYIDGANA
jgi:hypothetical protein